MRRFCAGFLLASLALTACSSNCDNAGVTVDDRGNIVVRGESGFVSPNSPILRSVVRWPQPPPGEQNFAFSQGYTLTRDGAMFVLENTEQHPNLVYRIDLASGASSVIGQSSGVDRESNGAFGKTNESWIAANDRYVFSVDQHQAAIRRADLRAQDPKLESFIAGSRTRLVAPIGVAVDAAGRLCALDGETHFLLCYSSGQSGNVSPSRAVDLTRLVRFADVDSIAFEGGRHIAVSGARNANGFTDSAIAVIDLSEPAPRVLQTIAGASTGLLAPDLAVDARGDILALQQEAPVSSSDSEILAFAPEQKGDVAPRWIRKPSATVRHPFRIAIDAKTNDVAILGSDGVAFFREAARLPPAQWPREARIGARGWSVAFGAGSLIVADQFGGIGKYPAAQKLLGNAQRNGPLDLHDPEFVATDQDGTIYTAAGDGVITRFPNASSPAVWERTTFATPYGRNMEAFAADSAGHYYLATASENAIVTVGTNGRQGVLSGGKTGLNRPLGLAVNRDGDLYVANTGANEILVFARGSSGDVAPIGRIAGAATQLVAPQALAVDRSGRLYVFDGLQTARGAGTAHHVRVYDANARGNVAPIHSYDVATKCWVNAP